MLAGRRDELATVCAALRAPGRVLVVIGEAGVGKSRLVTEAVAAVDSEVNAFAGRCLPLSVDLPLLPIVDVLRALLSAHGGALFEHAVSLCPPFVLEELARLLPELGGDPTAGEAQRERQFEAVRRVLLKTPSPVVVIDDLHWCDAASLDLLEYLIARPDGPAVVLISRPLTGTSDRVRLWLGRVLRLSACRRRGAQSSWAYAGEKAYRTALAGALGAVAQENRAADAEERAAAFADLAGRLHQRRHEPLPVLPPDLPRPAGTAARRAGLCFAQQALAGRPGLLPPQVREQTTTLIDASQENHPA